MTSVLDSHVTVTDLVAAVRRQQVHRPTVAAASPTATPERSVSVLGAHPGAGATAVAVAITDALAAIGQQVTLVDGASVPDAFGGTEVEIDSGVVGLRAGRRGSATIVRPEGRYVDAVPESEIAVLDGRHGGSDSVVVCRPTLPSVGRAERHLGTDALLAVVGASRWPKMVAPSLGPAAHRAVDGGRVIFFPHHRDLEVRGVDPEPTPANLLAAASRLIELLWPDLLAPASQHRWKGRRR